MEQFPWWQVVAMAGALVGMLFTIGMGIRSFGRDRKGEVDKLVDALGSRFGKQFEEATGKFKDLADQFGKTSDALIKLSTVVDNVLRDVDHLNAAAKQVLKMETRLEILLKDFEEVRRNMRDFAEAEDVMGEMEKMRQRFDELEKQLRELRDRVAHHSGTMTATILPRPKPR